VSARRNLVRLSACVVALWMLSAPAVGRAASLSIAVVANHFVNGAGQTVRLLGVNRESTEYACTYGYASSGPIDAGDAAVIAGWGADAVRVPLNEDCWLGINGLPADGLTAPEYQAAIKSYVSALNADGVYAILDLHWSAPGTTPSTGQYPMPDAHSIDFWTSVASAFEANPAVVFDVFNEPYSPQADGWSSSYAVSWSCWLSGGCTVPNAVDGTSPYSSPPTYQAVGMQSLVSAIRGTGASQPITIGGLSYANDLSGWLAHEPNDPDHQLAASFHNYTGESCDDVSCWNATIAPVATQVAVVTGEFDEDDCPAGGGADPANFDNTFMNWADGHGVSYLAWGWLVLDPLEGCSALTLLDDYTGTPADPNGVAVRDHLRGLAASDPSPPSAPVPQPTPAGAPAPGPAGTGGTSSLADALHAFVARYAHLGRLTSVIDDRFHVRFAAPGSGVLRVRIVRGAVVIAAGRRAYRHATTAMIGLRVTRAGWRLLRQADELHGEIVATFARAGSVNAAARGVTTLRLSA
jgi:endoglucanase